MRVTGRPPKHETIIADYTERGTFGGALIEALARHHFPITFMLAYG